MKNMLLRTVSRAIQAFGLLGLAATAHANTPFDLISGCCQQDECCHPAPACDVAYNPPGYFTCDSCPQSNSFWDSLRVRADFLWWRACEEGLALGTEEALVIRPDETQLQSSRLKEPNFHYDPGFKLGLSSSCGCDCWDVALNWTYFHTKASVHGEGSGLSRGALQTQSRALQVPTEFVSAWDRDPDIYSPTFAKGKWTLNMDWLDLEFGHKFYVSKCFIVRPFLGLRGVRVDQGYRTLSFAARNLNSFKSEVKAKNDFLGLGPRLGFGAELNLPCFFKLFGEFAGSLVFGRTQRHTTEHFTNNTEALGLVTENAPSFRTDSTLDRCSHAITDLQLGLKWEHCCTWCNRQHPISVAVSWEFHTLYGFNRFIASQNLSNDVRPYLEIPNDQFFSSSKSGTLSTQGLTVSVEMGF